jgi:hypothetical protein
MSAYALLRVSGDRTKDLLVRFAAASDLHDFGDSVGWLLFDGVLGTVDPPVLSDSHCAMTACDGTFGREERVTASVRTPLGQHDIAFSIRQRLVTTCG